MSPQDRSAPGLAFFVGLAVVAYLTAMLWALGYLGDPAVRWLTGAGYDRAATRLGMDSVPHLVAGLYLVLLATGGVALFWLVWICFTQLGQIVLNGTWRPR